MKDIPAFPTAYFYDQESKHEILPSEGMTLRDYFAAKAMQALMWDKDLDLDTREDVAEVAYSYADVMLKVREQ
jgi:hypothetical protein